jgi:hypothetical protein
MSCKHPKCKAFCDWLDQAVWILLAVAIFALWIFWLAKAVS